MSTEVLVDVDNKRSDQIEATVGFSPISYNKRGVNGIDPLQHIVKMNKIKPNKLSIVKENEKSDEVEAAIGLFLSLRWRGPRRRMNFKPPA